ncbi:MAG: hypothetical protein IT373_16285 [Polyangiaceae bacterium]|nr:hypothetical protein [Polyangiaceae bacterium]
MSTSFAAVLYRPSAVSERALSHGFAVALAGFDLEAPRLTVGELAALPGWAVAFYESGARQRGAAGAFEELDHAADLFEEELPPGLCVRDAASPDAVVYALVYADDTWLDDGYRFGPEGATRHFVREGEDGLEAGVGTADETRVTPLALPDDDAAAERVVRPHRGSTFLARELGVPVVPALVRALFEAERRVAVRLCAADPEAVAEETRALVAVLGRRDGRGAFALPERVAGVAPAASYAAFVRSYDWSDPADPSDLYRELAIGRVVGTLHFARAPELAALDADPRWQRAPCAGLLPIATLHPSALGAARTAERWLALAPDGEALVLVAADGSVAPAGPTFAELIRYLALGYKRRDAIEEDVIGALMLRAHWRSVAGADALPRTHPARRTP